MRVVLGYALYNTLRTVILGGIFLGTEFYPDETNVGMVAFLALCALWKLMTVVWGFWRDARHVRQQERDQELAKLIARETVLELDRMRRERV